MTAGFLEFIARAARLVQTGHAEDAESMLWATLEESELPADEDGGTGVAGEPPADGRQVPHRSGVDDDHP